MGNELVTINGYLKENGKPINLELKVECVMENLYAITGEFFND